MFAPDGSVTCSKDKKKRKNPEFVFVIPGISSLILLRLSEHVHDEVVDLCEHHEVNGQTRASVLGGGVARQPREGVVLLQDKSKKKIKNLKY